MTSRRLLLAGALALAAARPLAAQQPSGTPATVTVAAEGDTAWVAPWRLSYFPGLESGINEGPLPSLRLRYFQMAGYDERVTVRQRLSVSVGASFLGSWYGLANYVAPRFGDGWRLSATLSARRDKRWGYFGLGNEIEVDPVAATDANPFPYRVRRDRFVAHLEVTRRIAGPLHVAVAGQLESTDFAALRGTSAFASDYGATLEQDDASARVALVYDTRDNEYDTHRGLLLEAGVQGGTGGQGYSRAYSVLRGYASPRPGTVLAARLAGSRMSAGATLNARYELPAWETPINVLGGQFSNRGMFTGQLTGRNVLFGNAEVRQELKNVRDVAQVMVVGFLDAGRVFEAESFDLTTSGLKVSGGAGVGVKLLRASLFLFNVARGPYGWQTTVSNGWMF